MKAAAKKPTKPATSTTPNAIGDKFGGGFLAGGFLADGKPYALILAPKAEGEKEAIAWGATGKIVTGAQSYSDGPANTAAMAKAGSALAKWVRGLKIGGHKDWYLPSRLEALVLFGELRSLKDFEPDQPDGIARDWYWTSTQYAGLEGFAWYQDFSSGGQGSGHKYGQLRARAVRRIAI